MQPKRWGDEFRVPFGEVCNLGPIVFTGAIDDTAVDTGRLHFGDDLILQPLESGILQMIMRVDQHNADGLAELVVVKQGCGTFSKKSWGVIF